MNTINVAVVLPYSAWPREPFTPTGGIKRFVEIASRIWKYGVRYVIIDIPPMLSSADPQQISGFKQLREHHKIVRLHSSRSLEILAKSRYGGSILPGVQFALNVFKALNVIRKSEIDLILSPGEPMTSVVPNFLVSKITGIPFAIVVQRDPFYGQRFRTDEGFQAIYHMYKIAGKRPAGAFMWALMFNTRLRALSSSKHIAVSNSVAHALRSRGVTADFHIVGNGVDISRIDHVLARKEKLYDAIFVGIHTKEKGIEDLLSAWSRVVAKRPDGTLITVGPIPGAAGGAQNLQIRNMIKQKGLEKNVALSGPLSWDDTIRLVKVSKMLLFPSRTEAFPLVVGEALACEVPVVCYDLPAIRESYDCSAVVRCPIGDVELLAKRTVEIIVNRQYSTLGSIGRRFVRRYDWNEVARMEADAYRSLLKQRH